MTKRALIYARASLDLTGEARSVSRQEKACEGLCQARGWDIVDRKTDNSISAYGDKERPGWNEVLEMIQRGEVDVVVAWHFDRVTRSMTDLEHLINIVEKTGVGVATAVGDIDLTTDTGRMVARILAAVARAEVERKAARQKLGNAQRAAEGKPFLSGHRPFGYTDDQLAVVEAEAELIRWGAQALLDGASLPSVGRRWRELPPFDDKERDKPRKWTPRGVKEVMLSPRYAGLREYKGEVTGPAVWPAILDESTHLALRAKFAPDPTNTRRNRAGRTPTTLLSGLAVCDECGETVRGGQHLGRPMYRCSQRHVAEAYREVVDEQVSAAVLGLLTSGDFLDLLIPHDTDEGAEVQAELDGLHRRLEVLAMSFAEGTLDQSTYSTASRTVREKIEQLADRVVKAHHRIDLHDLSAGTPKVIEEWGELSLERKRALVAALVEVRIRRQPKGERWDAERDLSITFSGTA